MARVRIRFYAELNDFISLQHRQREFNLQFDAPVPVRHLIELQGVPHTEVELLLVNGRSVGLEHPVLDGDRVSAYPVFEALDVRPLLRLRSDPLRISRFVADAHLGRLAGHLRMLGFDCRYRNSWPDRELVRISRLERRILLTRDRALLMHRDLTHGCFVHTTNPWQQLVHLIERLQLCRSIKPFSRCICCNTPLQSLSSEPFVDRLPGEVGDRYDEILYCGSCDKCYWQGSHHAAMAARIQALCPGYDVKG